MKYQWKRYCKFSVQADKAHEAIEAVRKKKGGSFVPKDIVDAARKKSHILHPEFEWDDSVAGEKYRAEQARYMVRSIQLVKVIDKEEEKEPRTITIKPFTSMSPDGAADNKDSRFYDTTELLSDEEQRHQLLKKVWNQILSLRRKYHDLHEFAKIWESIDETETHLAEIG